jgi:hypothetical protein
MTHSPGMYKRLAPNLSMHTLLSQQIGHLLRARVLQELEILADQAQTQPQSSKDAPVLRRLTRTEFKAIKATGVIPYHNGVAVLIVPPLNRNSVTKQRPEPHSGLSPPDDREPTESTRHRDLPPLSALHPVEGVSPGFPDNLPNLLPESQIPLYNGVALFPSRSQRAALYSRLNHLLLVERRARYRPSPNRPNDREEEGKNAVKIQGDEKASHAFLLCSDATTASRGDVAALAIALWRIRMWEGFGWWEGVNQGWMGRQLQT